jgi:hypothetical protein
MSNEGEGCFLRVQEGVKVWEGGGADTAQAVSWQAQTAAIGRTRQPQDIPARRILTCKNAMAREKAVAPVSARNPGRAIRVTRKQQQRELTWTPAWRKSAILARGVKYPI